MRRHLIIAVLLMVAGALVAPVAAQDSHKEFLAPTLITGAVTGVTGDVVMLPKSGVISLSIQAQLTYGSGGTTAKFWVQTSLDGGTTWIDIANFAFTTASARVVNSVRSTTAVAANYTATDGTLADNTIKDGIIGDRIRVKYTTTGTYAGSTTIRIAGVLR